VISRRSVLSAISTAAGLSLAACGGRKTTTKMEAAPAQFKVLLTTSLGNILFLVHRDWSPIGADHFYELVKMRFYDDNRFFRVVPNFIVQWGVNGDPKVNKAWSEIPITDDPAKVPNKIGTVVFAKTGEPNSRTTQLFINLGDNSGSLDAQGFTPFGEVVQGMENVMRIYSAYGEQPSQAAIADIGQPYLEEHFPKLDYIKKAQIVP
jgi:peptidyl-prolyl cis-trans isomerase A (cyclophilin A)